MVERRKEDLQAHASLSDLVGSLELEHPTREELPLLLLAASLLSSKTKHD